MKHIFSFLFVVCLLAFSFSFSSKENAVFSFFKEGQCEFVVSKKLDISFLPKDASIVANGEDNIIGVNARIARYVFEKLGSSNVKGYVFKIESSFESLKQKLDFKYFKDSSNQNQKHYYAFSNSFDNFVFVDGKKVNMHIVEKDNLLVVGFPIILTSY